MSIPNREHILQAMLRIDKEGVPAKRGPRKWAVKYKGNIYPCKLLISWGNFFANGKELDPNPSIFHTYMAQDYLIELKFTVVPV